MEDGAQDGDQDGDQDGWGRGCPGGFLGLPDGLEDGESRPSTANLHMPAAVLGLTHAGKGHVNDGLWESKISLD